MAKKTISNSFTVNTVEDGESTFDVTLDNQIAGVECDKSGDIVGNINISFRISAHYGSNDVIDSCTITDNHDDVDSDIDVSYSQQQIGLVTLFLYDGNSLRDTNVIAFTVVHPQYGTRVVSFTVKSIINGESAPFYNEEWYAWSNVASTANTTTSPFTEPYSGWKKYIPEQGSLSYLWKKIIRYNYNASTKQYVASTAQYFRMSGTNGTSIHTRGQVANASSRTSDGHATIITDDGTETISMSDGDAVTQLNNGHLYQWVTEGGGKWLDLGQFKGESGVTYYTHIAWATNVVLSQSSLPKPAGQQNIPNATSVSGGAIVPSGADLPWMGYLIDTNVSDSTTFTNYTWSETKGAKGEDAVAYEIQTSVESVKIPSDETSVSKSITFRFYSKTGDADKQSFTTYYSIYYRGTSGFYTLVYPPTSYARSSYTYTFSNIGTSVSAIVVYIWGDTDYRGQFPEGQPYIIKKEIPILKDGDTGQAGERGKVGRFYYYSGFDWDASNVDDTFVVNDAQVPYFSKAGSNANKYYVFNPETIPASGSMTMAQMAAETSVGGQIQWNEAPWEVMTDDFKYLITQAIFAQFAKFGSAIISGDWMISQHGTINGVSSTNYTAFNPAHPNDNIETNFIPNYAVDLLTGTTYQHDTHITGGIFVDKVSKVICNTYIWGNNNQWVGTDFNYYLYNATEGEHIYDCDHVGSVTVHRDYYSVGKITLKSNFFFILASGIRDKDASATSGSLHIKLPNPKYFIGQSIVITNKSTGFPPNSLLLEQEYVRKNGSGPRHDGQGGSSEHYICTTAKELLLDYPNSQGLGEDGEPVLSNGTYTIIEDDNFTKEYNPTQTGLYSINGIYIANTNIARPTILTELDLNEYEWIELVAVEWNVESQSNILPAIVNEHFSDFYTQWMVTRWEKKATS